MLRRGFLLCLLAIVVAIPLLAPGAASAGKFTNHCGDGLENGAGWFNLKTKHASCRVARALADHYVFDAGGQDDGFKGWNCREKQVGDEVWRVNCHREKDRRFQRARFLFGA